jgi:uncharacterized protein YjiS (DUF1127 family)
MKSDKFFLADPVRLPELALASDCLGQDRSSARPDSATVERHVSQAATVARAGRRMGAAIARIAKWLFVAMERARQRRALAALSDHLLQDIGLTRADFTQRTAMLRPREEGEARATRPDGPPEQKTD